MTAGPMNRLPEEDRGASSNPDPDPDPAAQRPSRKRLRVQSSILRSCEEEGQDEEDGSMLVRTDHTTSLCHHIAPPGSG